jgi:hypothetical protein
VDDVMDVGCEACRVEEVDNGSYNEGGETVSTDMEGGAKTRVEGTEDSTEGIILTVELVEE